MVTQILNGSSVQIFFLTSSDTKPTDCDNGSIAIEVDTCIEYRYDAENDVWYDWGYTRWYDGTVL